MASKGQGCMPDAKIAGIYSSLGRFFVENT